MKKTYVIRGNIVPLLRVRLYSGHVYDDHAHIKSVWLFELAEQHGGDRMFTGPLTISAKFSLPYPLKSSKATQEKLRGCHVTAFPSVADLMKLLGELSSGILFNSDVIIVAITIVKVFCDDPVTEFTVQEIRSGKK